MDVSTHRLAGGDLEDLGREADGTLDEQLLVLRTVDEVVRDCVPYTVSAAPIPGQKISHGHFSRFFTFRLVSVIRILWIFAAGTGAPVASYSFSPLAT
jgi:hypothetical protein